MIFAILYFTHAESAQKNFSTHAEHALKEVYECLAWAKNVFSHAQPAQK